MAHAHRQSSALLVVAIVATLPVRATPVPPAVTDLQIAAFANQTPAEVAAVDLGAGEPDAGPPRCALLAPRSDQAPSASCLECHSHSRSHPYDIDYRYAAGTPRSDLASAEDVVRAGVLLPDGQIRCVTCHDRRSPWKYKIALPPGATPSPSVAARMRDGTFERPGAQHAPLIPGSEVTATPLCRVCHQF